MLTLEVIEGVPTITWNTGFDGLNLSAGQIESLQFSAAGDDVMEIDGADYVFSTANGMIVTSLSVVTTSLNAVYEIGYGPTVDSISGWTKLWGGNASTSADTLPRAMYIPAGNYLTLRHVSGTALNLRVVGITITQEVAADSNLNDDMDGNSP